MNRKPGSYVIDDTGRIRPNEADEAMIKRHGLKKRRPEKKEEGNAADKSSNTGKD